MDCDKRKTRKGKTMTRAEFSDNSGGTESLWRYCERKGIKFVSEATDVQRERDL